MIRRSSDSCGSGLGPGGFLCLPGKSSDRLSPKEGTCAFTAAVPLGNCTPLSCSAEAVRRRVCHGTLSNCRWDYITHHPGSQVRAEGDLSSSVNRSSTNSPASTTADWSRDCPELQIHRSFPPAVDRPRRRIEWPPAFADIPYYPAPWKWLCGYAPERLPDCPDRHWPGH